MEKKFLEMNGIISMTRKIDRIRSAIKEQFFKTIPNNTVIYFKDHEEDGIIIPKHITKTILDDFVYFDYLCYAVKVKDGRCYAYRGESYDLNTDYSNEEWYLDTNEFEDNFAQIAYAYKNGWYCSEEEFDKLKFLEPLKMDDDEYDFYHGNEVEF